jgi:hypothetical protein
MRYSIYDWAGNLMPWGEFDTFETAWEFLYQRFSHIADEQQLHEELGEYYIEQTRPNPFGTRRLHIDASNWAFLSKPTTGGN